MAPNGCVEIQRHIDKIGNQLVGCQKCIGKVGNNVQEGIMPRCLFFETDVRDVHSKGVVVVGINPGKSNSKERNAYKRPNRTYKAFKKYWLDHFSNQGYYSRMRELIDCLEIKGPILWTEMVKCENKSADDKLTFNKYPDVFRTCISRFLLDEVKNVPKDWPLIAVGRDSFRNLCILFPHREVMGIYHPSARSNNFPNLKDKRIFSKIKKRANNKKETAIWLYSRKK